MSNVFPSQNSDGGWRSVRELGHCSVCLHKDWCSFRDFTTYRLIACHRKPEGGYKIAANGAGLYKVPLDGATKIVEQRRMNIAPIKRRNAVYKMMLEFCQATDKVWGQLKHRGLSDRDITKLNYKQCLDDNSVPNALNAGGYELSHVPGFYFEDEQWHTAMHDGFFIPALDLKGRIQALQIRRFDGEPKYVWFSSLKKFNPETKTKEWLQFGASSGSPIHFRPASRPLVRYETVWITEGLLKGDILWLKKDCNMIAVAGVNNGHAKVCQWVIAGGFNKVVIAFDGNWRTEPQVRYHLLKLQEMIQLKTGIEPQIAVWDDLCGVDEAVIKELDIKFVKELPE